MARPPRTHRVLDIAWPVAADAVVAESPPRPARPASLEPGAPRRHGSAAADLAARARDAGLGQRVRRGGREPRGPGGRARADPAGLVERQRAGDRLAARRTRTLVGPGHLQLRIGPDGQ